MKKVRIIILSVLLLFIVNFTVFSSTWQKVEKGDRLELWQKELLDGSKISEALIYPYATIGEPILKGFNRWNIKNADLNKLFNIEGPVLKKENEKYYPIGFWKIVYKGFDKEGNIYLDYYANKGFTKLDKKRLFEDINQILFLSSKIDTNELLKKKYIFNVFEDFLERKLEIVINPDKKIVIKSINDIPPLIIKTNQDNSYIKIIETNNLNFEEFESK
ncbi:MAG: hypothetical protein PWR10_1756 [Halanaerobiales bacterium]|nr:hypothetical protein [Halanaerobiales bacterium]